MKQAFGPRTLSVSPLFSKDETSVLKDSSAIKARWTEHFSDLFHNPSVVDEDVIRSLPQRDLIPEMSILPTVAEVNSALKKINTGRAPGLDGIPVEVLVNGGEKILLEIHKMIVNVWQGSAIPQDWVDAILISLYKGKGSKSSCGNYRGISLLEAVGKVFSKLLLDRLSKYICPNVLPETQCGFRPGRGTTDMIFAARQLQEKSIEHRVKLYQVFVDLTKAFDTVNRPALWIILGKLGCPQHFVNLFESLHSNMKAYVNFNGSLSEPIAVDNGVKQGDIPAPTLFSIFFATMLSYAFKDCEVGVFLRFRTSGKVFNLRRFNASTKVLLELIRELLYADDADFVAHAEHDMQLIMDLLSRACQAFGLTISIKKTKVMLTTPPGQPYVEPNIFVNGERLEVVDSFIYLGSTLSRDTSLDAEVNHRVQKATKAFGSLEQRVWSDRSITIRTKISVYQSCVLTSLLYSSETWTFYRRHIKILERVHQKFLRRILNIKWQSLTPDSTVLQRAGISSIEKIIIKGQLRWAGHLVRMEDDRLPKRLFYGEFAIGKRPQYRPKKRFRDCLKNHLKAVHIDTEDWEALAQDRCRWRESIHKGCNDFERDRISKAKVKRAIRKGDLDSIPVQMRHEHVCDICGKIAMSKAGLASHKRVHAVSAVEDLVCGRCNKVCKSKAGLSSHMRVHRL